MKRIDGRSLGAYFRDEIAEPLGADFMIGFGPEQDRRCAEMIGDDDMVGPIHTREWRSAADGAATGFGTAEGLARVYAALACGGELGGVQVLRAETIGNATQEQPLLKADGPAGDFGLGSVGLPDPTRLLGFGHVMNQLGSGGAVRLLTATYGLLAA